MERRVVKELEEPLLCSAASRWRAGCSQDSALRRGVLGFGPEGCVLGWGAGMALNPSRPRGEGQLGRASSDIFAFSSLKDGGCTCPGDVAKAFGKENGRRGGSSLQGAGFGVGTGKAVGCGMRQGKLEGCLGQA